MHFLGIEEFNTCGNADVLLLGLLLDVGKVFRWSLFEFWFLFLFFFWERPGLLSNDVNLDIWDDDMIGNRR